MNLLMNMDLIQIVHSPGYREKGRWVEGERKPPIHFWGNAQPTPGKALEFLPDGKRNVEAITVRAPLYTHQGVKMHFTMAEPKEQRSGDIIVYKEKEYEVKVANHWDSGLNLPVDHWELIATRDKEGES